MPEAAAEFEEACTWYRNVRPELGDRFVLAIEAAAAVQAQGGHVAIEAVVTAVSERPLQFAAIYRGRRRAGVRRFPYGIFFEVQDARVLVIACFHSSRDPKRWQAR